ncbi:MAG: hypothetical protein AABX70_01590 [Nanoarchaeota archaeon]
MVLGKKAVVFTLIAILISVFLFLVYANEYTPKENALLPVVKNRVRILDRFNENFLQYSLEAIDISSFKAMNGMVAYAESHGFFASFESSFLECVQNGTLEGDPCPDMVNNTLPYWLDEITNRSRDKLGINVSYEILGIQTKQSVPFQVEVSLEMHYEIRDIFAIINRTLVLKRLVGIEGLSDPLYAVLGTYNNTIKATSTREDKWDNDTLYFMIYNRTYRYHTDAPSLISRFEGQLVNSSCCGVESMVNPNEALGFYQNKSFVDYLFWNSTAFCAGIPVQIVYKINYPSYDPKFRLEPHHLVAYNIGSEKWVSGCN